LKEQEATMAERVPFINRKTELAQIKKLIRERNTRRVLCIQATGGIGKTRLLQEVREQYTKDALIIGIIDFDDLALRIPANIDFKIAKQIGQNVFDAYLQSLQAYNQIRRQGVSPGRLAQKKLEVHQAFLDGFNEFSTQRRVALLLDTTDTLEGTEAWNYIVTELSQRLKNLLLIVAGRNAEKIYEELRSKIGRDAQFIELPPLDIEASKSYLDQKQELLYVRLEPELAEKLLLLAGGRPILIDLAVEWLAREIPLDWLIESSLQDLESLSDDEREQRREEFERQLVRHIAQIRTAMDRLTLVMSRVYPLDVVMIAELLKMPKDEARALFEEAQTYVFVKSLPDGRISLHDEMRRMVNKHVWPEADPDESRPRRDSELAAACLDHKAQTIQAQIDQSDEEQVAHIQKDITIDPLSEREVLRQQLWTLKVRALRHRLYLDPNRGFAEFDRLFRDAFNKRDSDFCIMLRETTKGHRRDLSKENQIRLDMSKGLLAILRGDLKEAVDLIHTGLEHLEQLGVTKDLDRIYNSLGYCYRLQGNWELAIASYERALHYSNLEHDAKQIAETMNNIANVCQFSGEFERGLRYTKTSLKIREKLGDTLSIANSCYVRGVIMWAIGNVAEATDYLERAKNLYQELRDEVRVAWVDRQIGYLYYCIGDLDTAREYLERATAVFRERNVKSNLADALNMLSRVVRRSSIAGRTKEELFQEAERYAREGLEAAKEIGDRYGIAQCHLTLCILYYRWGGEYRQTREYYEQAPEYYNRAREHYTEGYPTARDGNYLDLLTAYHMSAGNVAYDEGLLAHDDGDAASATRKWDEAFAHYLEECRFSATYKELRFDRALGTLASRLMNLPIPTLTQKHCNELIYRWKKRGLDHQYPQLVAECEQVKHFLDTPEERVVSQLSQSHWDLLMMGHWEGALETGRYLLEHNRVYLRNLDVIHALNHNAFALRQLGRFSEARRLCTHSLHIGERLLEYDKDQAGMVDSPRESEEAEGKRDKEVKRAKSVVAECNYVMGQINWIAGNTAQVEPHLRTARELFEDSGNVVWAARVRRFEGLLHFYVRNLRKAADLLEQARICFEEREQFADLAEVLSVESRVLTKSRQYELARQKAERANEIARKIGNNYFIAESLIGLYRLNSREARIAYESGNQEGATDYFDLAQQCLQEGIDISHRFGYDLLISVCEQIAAANAFDKGEQGKAFEHYVKALEHGARFDYARLHRALDPCIDRLVQLPEDQIRYYADYVVREWKARGLDTEFPDVVNAFELIKEYREYVSQA